MKVNGRSRDGAARAGNLRPLMAEESLEAKNYCEEGFILPVMRT